MGTQQSGILDLLIADIAKDGKILEIARQAAQDVLNSDPKLEKEENAFAERRRDGCAVSAELLFVL